MKQYINYIALGLFLISTMTPLYASRPLYYINCDIKGTVKSVKFLEPQLESCVTDNTLGCDVVLGSGYQGPVISSRYILTLDIEENFCINLDTNENYEGDIGIRENIRLFRYNTWASPEVGDTISGTIYTFDYIDNIALNTTQGVTSIQQIEAVSENINVRLENKYRQQGFDTAELDNKIYEVSDKLRVFALKIPKDRLEQYITAAEKMLKNPRFQSIQEEIELLIIHLYTW